MCVMFRQLLVPADNCGERGQSAEAGAVAYCEHVGRIVPFAFVDNQATLLCAAVYSNSRLCV